MEGIITLGSGHSLVIGHKPKSISDSSLAENQFKAINLGTIESFGLFGDGMNYNTYYPEVSSDDFNPKDTEFIEPVYRLLSECIVSKYYPTDFSVGGVLKKSMKLLIGQTVNCDHETSVGNAIGVVKSVYWQEAYTDEKTGIFVPAGINGTLRIDAKANPRLARGIMMDPPSIHSNSVTVRFTWEQSHPHLSIQDFQNQIGSYDKDGKLIKRDVTGIIAYMETSLVSHGADPWAKKIGENGRITHVEDASRAYSFSDSVNKNHYFFKDFKDLKNKAEGVDVLHNTMLFINENEYKESNKEHNNIPTTNEMEELLKALFGENMLSLADDKEVATSELAIEKVKSLVSEVARLKQELEESKGEGGTDDEELLNLREQVKKDEPLVTLANEQLSSLRASTESDYVKLTADKADQGILTLIKTGDFKTVTSLQNSYKLQLEEKFPLSCKSCGSHDVSRASSSESTQENSGVKVPKSTQDVVAELRERELRKKN